MLPWLYVGNQKDAMDPDLLQSLHVTRVLALSAPAPPPPPPPPGFHYRLLPASDTDQQNIKQYFDEAFNFIGNCFRFTVATEIYDKYF